MAEPQRRKELQQKQAFQNITIAVPYFISSSPTKILAVSPNLIPSRHHAYQSKIHHNGSQFISTRIIYFDSQQEASAFEQQCQDTLKREPGWCEFCKDLNKMEGILYQAGKIYVPFFDNKQLREFLNDVSQRVVFGGAAVQQLLRRSHNRLFRFLDQNSLSLQHIYYRWRVFSYLQGDGEKRYRSQSFRMVECGNQWYPPCVNLIQRSILNRKQRKYFHQLLFSIKRKKQLVEQAMSFCVFNIACALEIATVVFLQIFEKTKQDFMPLMYLISDILFNTTTHTYRRLFGRMIPFFVYYYGKEIRAEPKRENELKYRAELKALIRIFQMKFIFDQNYTKGLLFMLNCFEGGGKPVKGVHQKLRAIGNLDDAEGEIQLEKMCFENGIPLIESEKEECMSLLNEYLWQFQTQESIQPKIDQSYDGQPINQKDLLKIKAKQVKVVCCENLPVCMLLEKNWQTKTKNKHSMSNDHQA